MMKLLILFTVILVVSPVLAQDLIHDTVYVPEANNYTDQVMGGCVTYDENFVLGGYTTSFEIWVGDCYLMKVNTDADTLWTGTYGSPYRDYGRDVVETYDSGLAAVGYGRVINDTEEYRVRLYRTDSLGVLAWEKDYVNANGFYTYGLVETADSGFAIVGYTGAYGNYDMFLLRTNSTGDSIWCKTYGGDQDDKAYAVTYTDDDGFIIVGETQSYGSGKQDLYIYKVDAQGDSVWATTVGDTTVDLAYAIERTDDGNFIVAGSYIFSDPDLQNRMFLIKIQDDGAELWRTSVYSGTSASARAVCEAVDGGYIAVGVGSYGFPDDEDVLIARFNSSGDSLWAVHHGGNAYDIGTFVHQAADGIVYVGGSYAASSYGDYYFLKLGDNLVSAELIEEMVFPGRLTLSQNRPNPFNAATRIEYTTSRSGRVVLEIYNSLGQKVATLVDRSQAAGTHTVDWDGTSSRGKVVASGVYFYQVKTDDEIQARKMILMK